MKMIIGSFMFALVLGVGMASLSFAAGDMDTPSSQTVSNKLDKRQTQQKHPSIPSAK